MVDAAEWPTTVTSPGAASMAASTAASWSVRVAVVSPSSAPGNATGTGSVPARS